MMHIRFLTVGTTSDGIGIMFLNEVALGKEHQITRDDSSLKAAPKGYDSVLAKGRTEPGTSFSFYCLYERPVNSYTCSLRFRDEESRV